MIESGGSSLTASVMANAAAKEPAAKTLRAPARKRKLKAADILPGWSEKADMVGISLALTCDRDASLYAQYTIGLHAWLLSQIQKNHPALSKRLHDNADQKAFTISGLNGVFTQTSQPLMLQSGETYRWQISALSNPVVKWLSRWLTQLPEEIDLRGTVLKVQAVELSLPPETYGAIAALSSESEDHPKISLSFPSPTSFRRKNNHFPLPLPFNLFHSYLRRWNNFAKVSPDPEDFLDWIDRHVVVSRHHIQSQKIAAGKRGSVTGFVGAVELALDATARLDPAFVTWFYRLAKFAPYCGTGHKTTFGLGQTQLGWQLPVAHKMTAIASTDALVNRIANLTEYFIQQRKRVGGSRAQMISETWATILARREQGDSLIEIAEDLEMNYETVKTYSKLARRAFKE